MAKITRRQFFETGAIAAAGLTVAPSILLGKSALAAEAPMLTQIAHQGTVWRSASADAGPNSPAFIRGTGANPYMPLWEHVPDGKPRVFEDPDNPGRFRFYLIGSHDLRVNSYCGPDIRVWSAPVEDLTMWRDEGPVFTFQDPLTGLWDVMFAPDMVELNRFAPEVERGEVRRTPDMRRTIREYYLYPHSRGPGREAIVCKGARPSGPFTVVNLQEDGRRLQPGSVIGFDPGVYVEYVDDPNDPDYQIGFRAYGYWGFQESWAAELDQNTMWSVRPGRERIRWMLPASSTFGVLRDPEHARDYPFLFPDEDPTQFGFFEASALRKIGNKYIWVYSGHSGPDYGMSSTNSALRFAFGDTPLGPWRSGGVLVDSRGPVPNEEGTQLIGGAWSHNTHGGIQLINDQWYVFYHRPPRGDMGTRQAMADPIHITWDERSVADGGRVSIRAYDPFAENRIWTARDSRGFEYTGAQYTSEGFHMFGLPPYDYYSAGYVAFLRGGVLQSTWDIWDNNMPITNITNGAIIGYKHFGFGGLSERKNGLIPFEGTSPGNNTHFNLYLTPRTTAAFRVNVWLDGPWDNDVWNGTKIGEIDVPARTAQETARFSIDVSQYVDHLDKKHGIWLVAERVVAAGPGGGGGGAATAPLFDLVGLGFTSDRHEIERHVPPTINISVNGVAVNMPPHPVRSTYQNGLTGYDLYEVYARLSPNVTVVPTVTAYSDDPSVRINITQATSAAGKAVVKFDYMGVVKTYNVIFDQNLSIV